MTMPIRLTCLSLTLSGLLLSSPALAGSGSNAPSSSSSSPGIMNPGTILDIDATYDFSVWTAADEIVWYLTIYYKNGTTSVLTFSSEEAAWDTAEFYAFHVAEMSTFDIEPKVELGDFVYVQTFDTLAEAEALQAILENIGLVVDIHWIRERSRMLSRR